MCENAGVMAAKKRQPKAAEPADKPLLRIDGDALYEARRKLGLTQLDVCRREKGLTPSLLSRLEGNVGPNVTLEVVGRLARGYGVKEWWTLCTFEPRPAKRTSRR